MTTTTTLLRRGRIPRRLTLAILTFATLTATGSAGSPAAAEETRITVRVISRDAKFVGTSMGGARVTLTDVESGEILARGTTAGSTGDTQKIMREPRSRGGVLSTPDSARFEAAVDLDEPRLVRIAAAGPLAQRQSATETSITQWILPGKHLTEGDGILLVLPGFMVDVLAPPSHQVLGPAPQEVTFRMNLTMACGCPTNPGGLWDSNAFEIRALVKRDGQPVAEVPLTYAGETSQFSATWTAAEPGAYEATVYAYDATNGNTGVDRTTFIVSGN